MNQTLINNLKQKEAKMIEIRRYLHQHPELSFHEDETSQYIADFYKGKDVTVEENVGQRGVKVTIDSGRPGKTLAIRADFDALPIEEDTDLPFASQNKGVMHACGHDAHTAYMLVLAETLAEMKDTFTGKVIVIHQPAEEVPPGGAIGMIKDGVLEGVDNVLGVHVMSTMDTGKVFYHPGFVQTGRAFFKLKVTGKGGHGSSPHTANDAIVAGAQFVSSVQTIVSRRLNPHMIYASRIILENIQCVKRMIYTDLPMIDIAIKNGYSNSALMARTFKKWLHTTPSLYRDKHQVHIQNKPKTPLSEKALILHLSRYVISDQPQMIQSPEMGKQLDITLAPTDETIHQFKHIIQIGDMDALLMSHVQQQLMTCQSDISLTHVLIKDPLSSPHLISNEVLTDESISNFQHYNKVDACLDYLKRQNIGLIMTLTPDNDLEDYLSRLKAFLTHLVMRMDTLEDWDLKFYIQHLTLPVYQKIMACVKRYLPNIKIIVQLDLNHPLHALNILQYDTARVNHVGFDANQNDLVNFDTTDDGRFDNTKHHIVDKAHEVIKFLKQHHIDKPLALINWNTLTGNTQLTNGEYFRGGIIFEQFLRLNKVIDTIGYWLNYDLHILHAKNEKTYMNSIELFHQYNSKRPAFFTSHLFKKLSSQVIYHEDNCIVVGTPEHFQMIVYDAEHFNPYLSLNTPLPFLDNKDVALHVHNLESGLYRVKHYTLDKAHGALYQVWQSFNTRTGIDAESISYIERLSYPKLEVSEKHVTQAFTYNLKLLTNAIHLIDVKKYID